MKNTIYDYEDYKAYIIEKINNSPSKGRGIKLKISECLSCQTAFVSQVLIGQRNFSLEQAVKLNIFLIILKMNNIFLFYFYSLVDLGVQSLVVFLKMK